MRTLLCALLIVAAPGLHAACNDAAGPKVDWTDLNNNVDRRNTI